MYKRIEVQPCSILELARLLLNSQALSEHTLPQSAIGSLSWKRYWDYVSSLNSSKIWKGQMKEKKSMVPTDSLPLTRSITVTPSFSIS